MPTYDPTTQKAIIHVDGDGFFASCEVAINEALRGRPVITGQEKGMAIAVTYEAKDRGISRGMLISDIRKLCPDAVILPGNYDLYKVISQRMYSIVRRYAPVVEEYSVDECFADISSASDDWNVLVDIARKVQRDLHHDLGMTFSLGLGPTKTLAKVASKWKKPAGFTAMQHEDIQAFLEKAPIGAVWGIGASLSAQLQTLGVKTALDFARKPYEWIAEHFSKPTQELWYELNGIPMHRVGEGSHEKHKSIRATRTFRPSSKNKDFILSQLSKNAEKACGRLRKYDLQSRNVYFYLKTQTFRYKGCELKFPTPITTPSEIMNEIKKNIDSVFQKNTEYRASGIVLNATSPATMHQPDLFGMNQAIDDKNSLYKNVDTLYKKYPGSIFLASSLRARSHHKSKHKNTPTEKFFDLSLKLGIPSWGEAR